MFYGLGLKAFAFAAETIWQKDYFWYRLNSAEFINGSLIEVIPGSVVINPKKHTIVKKKSNPRRTSIAGRDA